MEKEKGREEKGREEKEKGREGEERKENRRGEKRRGGQTRKERGEKKREDKKGETSRMCKKGCLRKTLENTRKKNITSHHKTSPQFRERPTFCSISDRYCDI